MDLGWCNTVYSEVFCHINLDVTLSSLTGKDRKCPSASDGIHQCENWENINRPNTAIPHWMTEKWCRCWNYFQIRDNVHMTSVLRGGPFSDKRKGGCVDLLHRRTDVWAMDVSSILDASSKFWGSKKSQMIDYYCEMHGCKFIPLVSSIFVRARRGSYKRAPVYLLFYQTS